MEITVRTKEDLTRWEAELTSFINVLKASPTKDEILVNKFADNSLYIPIGMVESKLDYLFNGLWETKEFNYSVIVNELVCSLQLRVFHPKAMVWIERTGVGAVQIQLKAEYEVDEEGKRTKKAVDVLDVSKKIANTLTKDFPHAKAEALKNAAKSLGNILGRDLNRKFEDIQETLTIEDAEVKITSIESKKELTEFYATLPPAMKSDPRIKKVLKEQETFLKGKL